MNKLSNASKWLLARVDLHSEIDELAPILGDDIIEKLKRQDTRSVIDLVSLASTRYSNLELTEQEKERISAIYEYLPPETYENLHG